MKLLSRNKVVITYGLAIVNLIVIVLFSLLFTTHSYNKLYYDENIYQIVHALDNLTLDLTKGETDVKNFILTSDKKYVNDYKSLKKVLMDKINELEKLVEFQNPQHKQLAHLNELVDARLYLLDHAIEIRQNGRMEDASYFLESFNEKMYIEKISDLKSEIINIQKGLIQSEKQKIEFSLKSREYIILSASLASLLISIVAIGTIVKDLKIRILNEKKLMKINSDKDRFFSIISHDLKGPAYNLLALCDILKNDTTLSPEERNNMLGLLENVSRQNYNLLVSLLDWARMQLGKMEPSPKMFDLHDVVNDNFKIFEHNVSSKGICLNNHVSKDALVYADYNMVNTVIRNVLNNAIKYSNHGGCVDVTAEKNENFVIVTVADNGIGMTEETLKKLFKLGEQRSLKGTAGEEGTGLGLLLCFEFIKRCGGHIWVDSEVNKGTKIYMTLPSAVERLKSAAKKLNQKPVL